MGEESAMTMLFIIGILILSISALLNMLVLIIGLVDNKANIVFVQGLSFLGNCFLIFLLIVAVTL